MPTLHLTDLSVKALKPVGRQATYWDDTLPGFGCRVSQRGTKSWVVMTGRERKLTTFARYPDIALKDARAEAKRILAEKTLGKRVAPSLAFEDVKARYLAACAEKNRPRTVADYTRLLKHFPFKGKIGDIGKHHVVEKLNKIEAPSERAHALVAVRAFFRWVEGNGYIEVTPCGGLKPAKPGQRERALADNELRAVLAAARETPWPYGPIIQLLAFTGQRRGEIAALRWDWVDQKERTITLPGSVTKNKRAHTFPYGDLTAAVLDSIPQTGEYLFPASRATWRQGKPTTTFNGWGKAKNAFDKTVATHWKEHEAKGPMQHWTPHDLRRTFSTNLAALGVPVHVTEKLLNHVSGTISGVAAVYNRYSYMDEMREAIRRWEAKLSSIRNQPLTI